MISASAAAIVKSGLETCMYATDVYDSFQNFHNTFDWKHQWKTFSTHKNPLQFYQCSRDWTK